MYSYNYNRDHTLEHSQPQRQYLAPKDDDYSDFYYQGLVLFAV